MKNGRTDRKLGKAVDWLRAQLAAGPVVTSDIKAMAEERGISWELLRAAKGVVGCTSVRVPGLGPAGWAWVLPGEADSAQAAPVAPATPARPAAAGSQIVRVEWPFPPSVNGYWRSFRGRQIISKDGRAYRKMAQDYARQRPIRALDGPLVVVVDLYPPDRRQRDADNYQKGLFDSLGKHGAGIIGDDRQIKSYAVHMHEPGSDLVRLTIASPLDMAIKVEFASLRKDDRARRAAIAKAMDDAISAADQESITIGGGA